VISTINLLHIEDTFCLYAAPLLVKLRPTEEGQLNASRPAAGSRARTRSRQGCEGLGATAARGCRTDTCAVALTLRPVASVLPGAEVRPMAKQHRCVLGMKRSLGAMPHVTSGCGATGAVAAAALRGRCQVHRIMLMLYLALPHYPLDEVTRNNRSLN
jgi:hypothetical protein